MMKFLQTITDEIYVNVENIRKSRLEEISGSFYAFIELDDGLSYGFFYIPDVYNLYVDSEEINITMEDCKELLFLSLLTLKEHASKNQFFVLSAYQFNDMLWDKFIQLKRNLKI